MSLPHLNSLGTVTLETERLRLSRFREDDADAMFRNWASDPQVTKYLTWRPHESQGVTAEVIRGWVESYGSDNFYQWAIRFRDTDEPFGSISLMNVSDAQLSCEMGYCIGRDRWHMGFTSEAARAVLRFAMEEVGFMRLQAKHCASNIYSGMVMEKIGMTYEGTARRGYITLNDEIEDLRVFSFVKGDLLR